MKKLIILVAMICLLIYSRTYTQEEFIRPPAKFVTKFSFTQLTGGIIIVKGLLDDIPDTLNFVLDTGSSGISLDSTTTDELHLVKQKSDITIKGINGIRNVDFTYNHTLHLFNLSVEKLNFHINDYGLLSNVYGVRIDGIIGASFFRRYIVKIDYDTYTIEVYTIGYMKYPRGGYLLHPTFQSLPAIKQHVKDEQETEGNFILDCGAGLNVLLSQDFIDEHLSLTKDKKFFTTFIEGVGGKRTMKLMTIKSVQFGPYRFKKIPVYVFDDETNITDYPLYGGLIGNDLMRRFNCIINYADGIFYYKPNAHFNDVFDYSYTGFNLYDIDGRIKIMDIIPGSPGASAGLKEDDILVGIESVVVNGVSELENSNIKLENFSAVKNNFAAPQHEINQIASNHPSIYMGKNIQTFKNLLQNAGATIKLLIMRDGHLIETNLKVRNILKRK